MFDAVEVVESIEPDHLRAAARGFVAAHRLDHLLVFACEQPGLDLDAVAAALSGLPLPVTGAVFPTLIEGASLRSRGAFLLGLARPTRRVLVHDVFEGRDLHAAALRTAFPARPAATVLALIDGQAAGAASRLVEALQPPFLAPGTTMLGGGAGYWLVGHDPCLFTEDQVLPSGGAVLLHVEGSVAVAVAHGWTELAGPFHANRTHETTVLELDWRPALDVYRDHVHRATGLELGAEPFAAVSKLLPLAVLRRRGPPVLRDPVAATDDGGLLTLGDVPQHALVSILQAKPEALLEAASSAARAVAGARRSAFVFDCITRVDALGTRYPEELRALIAGLQPLASPSALLGALSLGELASRGDRVVEWHNKSVVVGAR